MSDHSAVLNECTFQGELTKRGKGKRAFGRQNFKRRTFVLNQKKLFYYEGTDLSSCVKKGELLLKSIRLVEMVDGDSIGRKHMFLVGYDVSATQHHLYLQADSDDIRASWIYKIRKGAMIAKCRTQRSKVCKGFYLKGSWSCCDAPAEIMAGCTATEKWKAKDGEAAAVVYNDIADIAVPVVNATTQGAHQTESPRSLPPIPAGDGGRSGSGGGGGGGGGSAAAVPMVRGDVIYSNADDPTIDGGEVIYEAYGSSDEEDDGGDGAGAEDLYATPKGKGKPQQKRDYENYVSPGVAADVGAGTGAGGGARPALPPKNKLSEQQRNIQWWLTSNAGRDEAVEALLQPGITPGCFCIRNNSSGQGKAIVLVSDQGKIRHYRLTESICETGTKYGMQDVKAWSTIQLDSIQSWLDRMSKEDARAEIQTCLTTCVPCPTKGLLI